MVWLLSFERPWNENLLGKKGMGALVCLGRHLSLLLPTPAAAHAYLLPALMAVEFETLGDTLQIMTNEASVHCLI